MSPYRLATRLLIQGALLSLGITLVMGLVAAVMSTPVGAAWFGSHGLDMRDVRPLHTVYGAAWPILAALAGLYHHLHTRDRPVGRTERWRLRIMVVSWSEGKNVTVVVARWKEGASRYLRCTAELSGKYLAQKEDFAAACTASRAVFLED